MTVSQTQSRNCSPMVWKDEWENADPEELGEQYVAWVHQIASQGLHSKADIAKVLAILSNRIKALSSLVSETGPRDSLTYFVRESNRIEGIHRDPTKDELVATAQFVALDETPTVSDLIDFVKVIQPNAVPRFTQGRDVRVGNHIPPRGGPHVQAALLTLLGEIEAGTHSPYTAHQAYEHLHPFTDGNGRSGRALWLWMVGGHAPLGFLHSWYYQSLDGYRK